MYVCWRKHRIWNIRTNIQVNVTCIHTQSTQCRYLIANAAPRGQTQSRPTNFGSTRCQAYNSFTNSLFSRWQHNGGDYAGGDHPMLSVIMIKIWNALIVCLTKLAFRTWKSVCWTKKLFQLSIETPHEWWLVTETLFIHQHNGTKSALKKHVLQQRIGHTRNTTMNFGDHEWTLRNWICKADCESARKVRQVRCAQQIGPMY